MKHKLLLFAFALITSLSISAAPFCVPTSTNGSGTTDLINGVNLGTLNNQNTGGAITSNTYSNYTALSTSLAQAATFTMTITSGTQVGEYYAAWIDFNGDSAFATTEKLGQVQSQAANGTVTITFTVPANTVIGAKRLRVRSTRSNFGNINMDGCTSYTRGETEDYTVNIIAGGGSGPIANFGAVQTTISLGNTVSFVDSSSFTPTAWQWTFAGGTPATSTSQNPTGISYSAVGCYAVTLTATNANGSNSLTKTCYIIVNPANPYCNSLYLATCSSTNNINSVNITNTTLNNSGTGCNSQDGVGYSAFAATGNTTATLYRGQSYQLNVTSSSTNSSLAAWIDYSQNKTFEASEFVNIASPATQNLASTVIVAIPAGTALGTVRMRVRSNVALGGPGGGSSTIATTDACTQFTIGETEDYDITIADAPAVAPIASFSANNLTITAGQTVNFTDLSSGKPTSWKWTFTGATTTSSTSQNPTGVSYNNAGCFDVKLVAKNAQGSDSITQVCYITVNAKTYCSTLYTNGCGNVSITNVNLSGTALNNTSTCDNLNGSGYSSYPASGAKTGKVYKAGTYQLNVTANQSTLIIGMWIDYDQSTTFEASEYLSVATSTTANIASKLSITIPKTANTGLTTMRIRTRVPNGTMGANDACTQFGQGETEDYVLNILPEPTVAPVADFSADSLKVGLGQSVNFTDLSTNLPSGWFWTFTGGIPSSSTAQNPGKVVYNALGCYTVKLVAFNAYGVDTIEKTCYINVVIPPYCTSLHSTNCSLTDYINQVSISGTTINNNNTGCNGSTATSGYFNFPATAITSDTLNKTASFTVSVVTSTGRAIGCWIDYNQNGTFETSEYHLISANSTGGVAATGSVLIPSTANLGTTRMRIRSRSVNAGITSADACTVFANGETEDYTVIIGDAPKIAPVANFTADSLTIEIGHAVNFKDLSTNAATSWSWTFTGAATTASSVQNPTGIIYNSPGCYTVSLTATNAYGSTTKTITCFITVKLPTYCATVQNNGCGGGGGFGGTSINTVAIAGTNFNNANTGCVGTTYTIYPVSSKTTAILNRGTTYNISVASTATVASNSRIAIWIDFNQNYLFDASEYFLVANSVPINIPATIAVNVPSTAVVGQVGMRVRLVNTNTGLGSGTACSLFNNGETEDYTVTIGAGGNNAPSADFVANFTSISPYGSINFSDNSSNTPTSWSWSFPGGSPSTSNSQNPSGIIYSTPGCYDVKLVATNAYGTDSITKACYINVTTAATYCTPTHTNACTNGFINTVQITGTTLNNANSGCNNVTAQGYTMWPSSGSTTCSINRNSNNTLKVTCSVASRVSVWIDYNHNNIFETTEWTQVATTSTANVASSVSIFVPSTAVAGPTGMRIRSVSAGGGGGGGAANGASNPCTTFNSGETEDYIISIVDPTLIPVANFSATPTTICAGNTVTFTDLSTKTPNAWKWTLPGSAIGTSSQQNPTVKYDTAGVYAVTLTATNGNGSNTKTMTAYITVNAMPAVNAGASVTICKGTSTQLSGVGGSTFSWTPTTGLSNATIANPVANPTSTTIYTLTSTSNGCSASDTMVVKVNSATANAGSDVAICKGSSTGLSASGGGVYSWSPASGLDNANIASPIANPATTTTYTVTVTANGCTATDAIVVTVNSVTANAGADVAICKGFSTNLLASGGNSYTWSPSTGLSSTAIANPVANPTSTTLYTVTVKNTTTGCSATDDVLVTVNSSTANAGQDVSICKGGSTQLLASGGSSYSWSPSTSLSNAAIANPVANPTTTTPYIVTSTTNGCTAKDTVVVTVNNPTVTAGAATTICAGGSTQLSATGSNGTYVWSPATGLSNAFIANPTAAPTATTTYTVTLTSNNCTATSSQTITINPVNANKNAGADVSICKATSTQLLASGGTSYSWSPAMGLSNTSIANPVAKPATTTLYTVTVTSGACSATDDVLVTISNDSAAAGFDISVCPGNTAQLSAKGGTSYSWSPATALSATNVSSPVFTAGASQAYLVSIVSGTCTYVDTVNVSVGTVSANAGKDTSICVGGSVQLVANGGTSYAWTPSATLDNAAIANPVASPSVTTTYAVVSTSGACSATDSVKVTVVPSVVANAGKDVAICLGNSTMLMASGGSSYSWSPSVGLSNALIDMPDANPGVTTNYVVTVSNGVCSSTDTVLVSVQTLSVSANSTKNIMCEGDTAKLSASASGTVTYLWSPSAGLNDSAIANPTAIPAKTTTYTVTANDGVCTSTNNVTLTVNPSAKATITSSGATSFCVGDSVTLTVNVNALKYVWLPIGDTVSTSITVKANGCYSVGSLNVNGCTAISAPICVSAHAKPITPTIILANDGSISSDVTGTNYSWMLNSSTISNTTQSILPISNGVYTVAVSDSGCMSDYSASYNYIYTNITSNGVEEFVSVYPIPVKDILVIKAQFENDMQMQISIKDIAGRTIKVIATGDASKTLVREINMSHLPSGMYFVNFSSGNNSWTKRIVKE